MSNADVPITSYDFRSGPLRGTHLTLFPHSLLHRGGNFLETIPIHAVAAIRVAFAREDGKLGWGAALVVIALILVALSGPLASLAGSAAETHDELHGRARLLHLHLRRRRPERGRPVRHRRPAAAL